MNLPEFIESALPLAKQCRSKATEFFTKLAGGPREGAGHRKAFTRAIERSFMRWQEGSPNEEGKRGHLKEIFETISGAPTASAPAPTLEAAQARLDGLSARVGSLTAKQAAPSVAAIGRQVLELATHPSPKVSQPITKGIERSLTAQAKIDLKLAEVKALRTPRAKIEALQAFKHDTIVESNAEHEARCKSTRDAILQRMRDRMAGK